MRDFIDDGDLEEEDEAEFVERRERKKKHRSKKQKSFKIDDDDRDVIKENFGIDLPEKKSRLKRNDQRATGHAAQASQDPIDDQPHVKKEIEVKAAPNQSKNLTQIDTTKKRRSEYKADVQREYLEQLAGTERLYDNSDKLRQA